MNMSYCRNQNTANDLRDVVRHWAEPVDKEEFEAKQRIFEMAEKIVALGEPYRLEEDSDDDDEDEEDEYEIDPAEDEDEEDGA